MDVKEGIIQRQGNGRLHQSRRKAQIKVRLNLFYQPEAARGANFLDETESTHALKVLRMKPGGSIRISDGQGSFYDCTITEAKKGLCYFEVDQKISVVRPSYDIHIALAPTKNHDRLEWLVEKATEVGVNRISFFVGEHSERKKINEDRLKKVAVSAMKQSLKAWLTEIKDTVPFNTILKEKADQRFIAHLADEPARNLIDLAKKDSSVLVLIGPEGDFSSGELSEAAKAGFQQVTLGPHRLRTETAALAAVHIVSLINVAGSR